MAETITSNEQAPGDSMAAAQSEGRRWALGLMTGTSMDGIDAGWIESDGERVYAAGPVLSAPMPEDLRARLRSLALGEGGDVAAVEAEYTDWVAAIAKAALMEGGARDCAIVGFHGQTLKHEPARGRPGEGRSWQLGDGQRLAAALGKPVVYDFRSADVAAGGEGAPLASLFHDAISRDWPRPCAVLNLGGVANVTYLSDETPPLAFDTGPANAPCDDVVRALTGAAFDAGGALAAAGRPDEARLASWLSHPYFDAPPPKSLDRETFAQMDFAGLSVEDAAATATAFAARSIAAAARHLPAKPQAWYAAGGGRRNATLMRALEQALGAPVKPIEDQGWDGSGIESWAFAHLAIRSLDGSPLTLPTTTGAPEPILGGRLARP